jgi:uncharacterized protein YfbU (UPF0304 family)
MRRWAPYPPPAALPPLPTTPEGHLLIDPLLEPPRDMGALVNISRLEVGNTYVLSGILESSRRYQYVTVRGKARVIVHRYALDLDMLNRNKRFIARRSVRLLDNQDYTVFHRLTTEALTKAFEKKATRQAIDEVYEGKTGQSAQPGTGPADLIRGFVGVQPPKNAKGRKTRRQRYQRSLRRKSSRRNR